MPSAPISAHPSHVSWPHSEPHRRPQWLRRHASRAHFGTSITRFVAPWGAPPKANLQNAKRGP
eukprot:5421601-Pyramimonas_sp.AAC.1